jgi:DNA-binding MarR family transcriptional regulator
MTDVFDDLDTLQARYREQRQKATESSQSLRSRYRQPLSKLYLKLSWFELAEAMKALPMDRSSRLWLLLRWQAKVEGSSGGWLLPQRYMIERLGLHGKNYDVVVDRLERRGLIEVQRRPGKRALVRLAAR